MIEKNDFETFTHRKLDESVDKMDGASRTCLAAMRREAVASKQPRRSWWLPVSLATAMTALVLVWMMPQQQNNNGEDVTAMELAATGDMDLLTSDIELDLLEDVEFYQWLNDSDHAG